VELVHIPQNGATDGEAFDKIVAGWHERQSRIRVAIEAPGNSTYLRLDTLLAAGTPPDANWTQGSRWLEYVVRGAYKDLTSLVQRDRSFAADKIIPKSYDDQVRYQGKSYVVPMNTASYVMYYNKELFRRAGGRAPAEGWTWDDWFAAAERLSTGSGDQRQFGATVYSNFKWNVPWLKQIQKDGWDHNIAPTKSLLDDREIVDAMRIQAEMRTRYKYAPMPADNAAFAGGRVAMDVNGDWVMASLKRAGRDDWDVAVLPKKKRIATAFYVQGNVMGTSAKHPDAVWEWLKYITTDDAQRHVVETSARMPVTPEQAQKLWVPLAKASFGVEHPEVFLKQWEYGSSYFNSDLTVRLEQEALDPGFKKVMEGQASVQDGLVETARLATEILRASRLRA
jgi:multiple sugar transport system substrate-binding protein